MTTTTHDKPGKQSSMPSGNGSATDTRTLEIVCLSPQPWHIDLPTNRQQIMARIASSGHRVLYVDTGAFVGRHVVALLRGLGSRRSLMRQLVATETVAPGVQTLKAPALAPWGHRYRLAAKANAALTAWTVRRRRRSRTEPAVLWLYDPCFADCIGNVGERFAVYDCVDDYAEQAGADSRKRSLVAAYDALAASRSRVVFATARPLAERHRGHNANTHVVPNVGDFGHFAVAADESLAAAEVRNLRRPRIGFAGNFLAEKVDLALLETIAALRPEWTLVLVGPARKDTEAAVGKLARRAGVRWLGARPYAELPRYVAGFDVGIVPYLRNEYTRSCFPLKTFEYLSAGKAVVASGLPELEGMEPHVIVADGADAFIAAIERALKQTSAADIAARQALAAANTWETRTKRLLELVATEL
jgi:glycosyltransferase involved in cell wall biosynthesis